MNNNDIKSNILDNILENNQIDNTIEKKSRKKKDIFKEERNILMDKIFTILKVRENNNILYYNDITEDQKNKILELESDIKKYFRTATFPYYKDNKDKDNDNKNIMQLVKSLLKDENYTLGKMNVYVNKINKVGYILTKTK